jgi:hypothetical protein
LSVISSVDRLALLSAVQSGGGDLCGWDLGDGVLLMALLGGCALEMVSVNLEVLFMKQQ